jgi:hypothetical protein
VPRDRRDTLQRRDREPAEILRDVFTSRFGLVLVFCTLVSVVLLAVATTVNKSTHDVLIALATSLLASTVFAVMQELATARVADEVIRTAVRESVINTANQVLGQRNQTIARYAPLCVYEATNDSDPVFNADLQVKLATTGCYSFVGVTGRYAAAGLCRADHRLDEVHVFIADPEGEEALGLRAQHESASDPKKTYQSILASLREDIIDTMIGLREASSRCRCMYLHLVPRPQLNRFEIFDDCIFISLYTDKSPGKTYPRTMLFPKESMLYEVFAAETRELANLEVGRHRLRPTTTDQELINLIKSRGFDNFGPQEFKSAHDRFGLFLEDFAKECLVDNPVLSKAAGGTR